MATTQNRPIIKVLETRAVKYEEHTWLFFKWYVRVYSTKIRNDLFIETNDEFDSVFINEEKYIKA